ncbi:MAG: hypothetical protein QW491_09500 [Thermoproteota archaeon]
MESLRKLSRDELLALKRELEEELKKQEQGEKPVEKKTEQQEQPAEPGKKPFETHPLQHSSPRSPQEFFLRGEDSQTETQAEKTEAEWDTAYINDLPDAAFAYIAPGGEKDEEGKTKPRSLRYLPHHNKNVKDPDENDTVDIPHLRNALARLPQADIPQEAKEKARAHLLKHAKALLPSYQEESESAVQDSAAPVEAAAAPEEKKTEKESVQAVEARVEPKGVGLVSEPVAVAAGPPAIVKTLEALRSALPREEDVPRYPSQAYVRKIIREMRQRFETVMEEAGAG